MASGHDSVAVGDQSQLAGDSATERVLCHVGRCRMSEVRTLLQLKGSGWFTGDPWAFLATRDVGNRAEIADFQSENEKAEGTRPSIEVPQQ